MMAGARGRCRAADTAPTDPRLLENPLAFLAEDHFRERAVCVQIDRIATQPSVSRAEIAAVLGSIETQLPLHWQDEEDDLFPLMRRRCDPDDEIDKVIDRLSAEHAHAGSSAKLVAAILRDLLEGVAMSPAARSALTTFAAEARRHLIVENAIILPIARARLGPADLEALSRSMSRRRGL